MGSRSHPVRTCAGCGRKAAQDQLWRLAVTEEEVRVDPRRRLPGRGAYVHPRLDCARRLVADRGRDRRFRRPLGPAAWSRLLSELESLIPPAIS